MSEMAKTENDNEIKENVASDLAGLDSFGVNEPGTGQEVGTPLTQPSSDPVLGYVYFIRAGDHVKVGYSAQPLDRLQTLQTSHPEKLEILCTIPGSIKTERSLHARFQSYRVRGEWFRFGPGIRKFVKCASQISPRRRRLAAKAKRRPKPTPLPEVTRLLKLRKIHGADSAIGHHISVLAEVLPNHRAATNADQKAHLERTIKRTSAALELLLKAAA